MSPGGSAVIINYAHKVFIAIVGLQLITPIDQYVSTQKHMYYEFSYGEREDYAI